MHEISNEGLPHDEERLGAQTEVHGLFTRTTLLMVAGLAAGYGMFAFMAGKFLYPLKSKTRAWMFVCEVSTLEKGEDTKRALRLLGRYTTAGTECGQDAGKWRKWLDGCGDRLYFSDTAGYRWYVRPQ